jgi:CMP-N-acetylneuraminic acid synthetase
MLSRDCDACSQMFECKLRFSRVQKGEKVYCPNGTAHLVDSEPLNADDYRFGCH